MCTSRERRADTLRIRVSLSAAAVEWAMSSAVRTTAVGFRTSCRAAFGLSRFSALPVIKLFGRRPLRDALIRRYLLSALALIFRLSIDLHPISLQPFRYHQRSTTHHVLSIPPSYPVVSRQRLPGADIWQISFSVGWMLSGGWWWYTGDCLSVEASAAFVAFTLAIGIAAAPTLPFPYLRIDGTVNPHHLCCPAHPVLAVGIGPRNARRPIHASRCRIRVEYFMSWTFGSAPRNSSSGIDTVGFVAHAALRAHESDVPWWEWLSALRAPYSLRLVLSRAQT
ncbi:hypothetical protein FB45DRAFT_1005692 [Roridomyces roridus]|uniref:Uncharacterized protein n=1 Tax=Roridomyces roridus TaxID=1738132 RepID=A0AAD7BMT2_9AGAR|nr:hypothetical protein FB45DRAFT_1005692 [Roridomyces roridus]